MFKVWLSLGVGLKKNDLKLHSKPSKMNFGYYVQYFIKKNYIINIKTFKKLTKIKKKFIT